MNVTKKSLVRLALAGTVVFALSACGGSGRDTAIFEVTVVNGTLAQPLSPAAIIAHKEGFSAFTIGQPSSIGLEVLAEGGDNTQFISDAEADANVYETASADSPLGPGASKTITLEVDKNQLSEMKVSVVSMLVNTNDAITALKGLDVSNLDVGENLTRRTLSYDTGTEANSELAGTIPGPADSGEGFNAARDDLADQVTAHGGVITSDDGLDASVLTMTHKWDNPVATITVHRVQ